MRVSAAPKRWIKRYAAVACRSAVEGNRGVAVTRRVRATRKLHICSDALAEACRRPWRIAAAPAAGLKRRVEPP